MQRDLDTIRTEEEHAYHSVIWHGRNQHNRRSTLTKYDAAQARYKALKIERRNAELAAIFCAAAFRP